jgi:glutaredoxin
MGVPKKAILYTRRGCHLCDDARAVLERHGLLVEPIDIDQDPELVARYTHEVPVVWIDGQERFRGRVNEVLLKRLLESRP